MDPMPIALVAVFNTLDDGSTKTARQLGHLRDDAKTVLATLKRDGYYVILYTPVANNDVGVRMVADLFRQADLTELYDDIWAAQGIPVYDLLVDNNSRTVKSCLFQASTPAPVS